MEENEPVVTVSTTVKVDAAGVAVMVEVSKMVERTGVAVAVTVVVSGVMVTSCLRGEISTR
jgi:ABC-type transporter Mla MlaB component